MIPFLTVCASTDQPASRGGVYYFYGQASQQDFSGGRRGHQTRSSPSKTIAFGSWTSSLIGKGNWQARLLGRIKEGVVEVECFNGQRGRGEMQTGSIRCLSPPGDIYKFSEDDVKEGWAGLRPGDIVSFYDISDSRNGKVSSRCNAPPPLFLSLLGQLRAWDCCFLARRQCYP